MGSINRWRPADKKWNWSGKRATDLNHFIRVGVSIQIELISRCFRSINAAGDLPERNQVNRQSIGFHSRAVPRNSAADYKYQFYISHLDDTWLA